MFNKLDMNFDLLLDQSELSAIYLDKYELCMKPLFNSCDSFKDGKLSNNEWCYCFQKPEGQWDKACFTFCFVIVILVLGIIVDIVVVIVYYPIVLLISGDKTNLLFYHSCSDGMKQKVTLNDNKLCFNCTNYSKLFYFSQDTDLKFGKFKLSFLSFYIDLYFRVILILSTKHYNMTEHVVSHMHILFKIFDQAKLKHYRGINQKKTQSYTYGV